MKCKKKEKNWYGKNVKLIIQVIFFFKKKGRKDFFFLFDFIVWRGTLECTRWMSKNINKKRRKLEKKISRK